MSLSTWIEKYYPVPANKIAVKGKPSLRRWIKAVNQCIQKWEGAKKEVLKEHGITNNSGELLTSTTSIGFRFDANTCALCQLSMKEEELHPNCSICPLRDELEERCDRHSPKYKCNPFKMFRENDNPNVMIKALKATKYNLERKLNEAISLSRCSKKP